MKLILPLLLLLTATITRSNGQKAMAGRTAVKDGLLHHGPTKDHVSGILVNHGRTYKKTDQ